MREMREKEIDGDTYKIQQLGGWQGQRLAIRLSRILAPSLARLGGAGAGGLKNLDLASLAGAVDMLVEKLPPSEYEEIFKLMLDGALVTEGAGEVPLLKLFDLKMAGRPLTGLKLFAFCLEANFESFSTVLSGLGDTLRTAALSQMSPKTSSASGPATGSS